MATDDEQFTRLSDDDLRRTAHAMGMFRLTSGPIPAGRPLAPTERHELERMVNGWPIGPSQRGGGQ